MKIKRNLDFSKILITAVAALIFTSCDLEPQKNWNLVWSDEFNGIALDESNWNYDIGTGAESGLTGWGNDELEYYTDRSENIKVDNFSDSDGDGRGLFITAIEELTPYNGMDYTSARINSKGKRSFTYGRIEARIKLPVDAGNSQGIWPAFWMLGSNIDTNAWPECGEIDIMEVVGSNADTSHGTIHFGTPWNYSGNEYSLTSGDFGDEFHIFSIEWEPGEIRWYVDNELFSLKRKWYSSMDGDNAPFNRPFFILLNVAVGGNWPGSPDGNTTFPKQMVVDYVRVYE